MCGSPVLKITWPKHIEQVGMTDFFFQTKSWFSDVNGLISLWQKVHPITLQAFLKLPPLYLQVLFFLFFPR